MDADDLTAHPGLAAERALLAAAVDADVPVLGVCLGMQLLALALGARLQRRTGTEIGFAPVDVVADDPVLGALGVAPERAALAPRLGRPAARRHPARLDRADARAGVPGRERARAAVPPRARRRDARPLARRRPTWSGDLGDDEVDAIRADGAEQLPVLVPAAEKAFAVFGEQRAGTRMTASRTGRPGRARRARRPVRARRRLARRPGPRPGRPVGRPARRGPGPVRRARGHRPAAPPRTTSTCCSSAAPAGLGSHAGQIAFPGGRLEPSDRGPREAALREAVEETGLDPSRRRRPRHAAAAARAGSNHLVTPVPAWWTRPSQVAAVDHAETVDVFRVSVTDLLDPKNRASVEHTRWGRTIRTPAFVVDGVLVWGFTGHRARADVRRARLGRPLRRAPHGLRPLRPCTPSPRSTSPSRSSRTLLREQHPDLADLPLTWAGTGWDNALWRLGDHLARPVPGARGRPRRW